MSEDFNLPEFWNAARLKAAIEEGLEVGEPTSMAYAVTGEPYVAIGSPVTPVSGVIGVVGEGVARELAFDAETAYMAALGAFRAYAEDKTGKLYWRVEPELEQEGNRFVYYMRCLISNNPPLPKDHPRVKSYWDSLAA